MGALTVAGLCVFASLILLIAPRFRKPSLWTAMRWALMAVVLVLAAELLSDAERWSEPKVHPWWRVLTIGILLSVGLPLLGAVRWPSFARRNWDRWGQAATLFALSVVLAVGARWRIDEWGKVDNFVASLDASLIEEAVGFPVVAPGVTASTDAGMRVELELIPNEEATTRPMEDRLPKPYMSRVIIDDASPSPSNCHGWVFTGGKYMIRGRYVDSILRDNQYQIVTDPQPGDLIIYRNNAGQPIHTGLVKAVGDEGFVLIESKWGSLDTYLHLPNDQVYSKGYAYYRSPREGHLLNVGQASSLSPNL